MPTATERHRDAAGLRRRRRDRRRGLARAAAPPQPFKFSTQYLGAPGPTPCRDWTGHPYLGHKVPSWRGC